VSLPRSLNINCFLLAAEGSTPLHLLRGPFLRLRDTEYLRRLHTRLLHVLCCAFDIGSGIMFPSWEDATTAAPATSGQLVSGFRVDQGGDAIFDLSEQMENHGTAMEGIVYPETLLRIEFRDSLERHLFGSDILLALRLRLATADLCWVRPRCCLFRLTTATPCR